MNSANNPDEPDIVKNFKSRLLGKIQARLGGPFNRSSPENLLRFDQLLDELLQEERIVLSRAERKRLHDALLSSI